MDHSLSVLSCEAETMPRSFASVKQLYDQSQNRKEPTILPDSIRVTREHRDTRTIMPQAYGLVNGARENVIFWQNHQRNHGSLMSFQSTHAHTISPQLQCPEPPRSMQKGVPLTDSTHRRRRTQGFRLIGDPVMRLVVYVRVRKGQEFHYRHPIE